MAGGNVNHWISLKTGGGCSFKTTLQPQPTFYHIPSQPLATIVFPQSPPSVLLQTQTSAPPFFQSFTNLLNEGRYNEHEEDSYFLSNWIQPHNTPAAESLPDPSFDQLLTSHSEKLKEMFENFCQNHHSEVLRKIDEQVSKTMQDKDKQIEALANKIMAFEKNYADHCAEHCAKEKILEDKLKLKEMEVEKMAKRIAELEEKQSYYKSDARAWKAKAEKVEDMLWNFADSPRQDRGCGRPGCGGGQEEDEGSSFVGPEMEEMAARRGGGRRRERPGGDYEVA